MTKVQLSEECLSNTLNLIMFIHKLNCVVAGESGEFSSHTRTFCDQCDTAAALFTVRAQKIHIHFILDIKVKLPFILIH